MVLKAICPGYGVREISDAIFFLDLMLACSFSTAVLFLPCRIIEENGSADCVDSLPACVSMLSCIS